MGRIQIALNKAREAANAKAEAGNDGATAQVAVVRRPDLFKQAREVALEPRTLHANRIRGIQSSEPGAAAYKMLRTRVLHRMRSGGWHKLAVTSPRADAGKTLTSINLAISLAH